MDRVTRSPSVMEGHCEAKKAYPLSAADYKLLEEIGQGVSATVYRAICIPFNNEVVAIKNLDLEKCSSNLDEIRREAQTVSLIGHPNVVRAYCSFVVDHSLWVVMPYLAGGSCLHVMKVAYPDGFEEPVIATVLRETLKALDYLHKHGHIHRDVKAGNILIDGQGGIKLGDFGVSACMFDTGDRQRSRNTFVGTPCWMAPEVMEQVHGYDFKADIWSFGITALELAHGHAPFSKYPPMKVLLMTLQNAPPGLDYERDKRFSKSFKEMIAMCLVKDPAKRPTAEKLLKHSFFKNARSNDYIAKHVLEGLPPLGERVKNLKLKDAARLAQKKMPYGEQEEKSQSEYKRGVSCWNFNVEDLKGGAALIQDEDSSPRTAHCQDDHSQDLPKVGVGAEPPLCNGAPTDTAPVHPVNDHPRPHPQLEEPSHACQAPPDEAGNRGSRQQGAAACLVTGDGPGIVNHSKGDGVGIASHSKRDGIANHSKGDSPGIANHSKEDVKAHSKREDRESYKLENGEKRDFAKDHKGHSMERNSTALRHRDDDKDYRTNIFYQNRALAASSGALPGLSDAHVINGIPMVPRSSSYKDVMEEKTKGPLVQKKGRFSVTSEDVEMPESIPQTNSAQAIPCSMILPQLRTMLQQSTVQQDMIHHLISSINAMDGAPMPRLGHGGGSKNFSRTTSVGNADGLGELDFRDRDQHLYIAELQNKIANLADELQLQKLKNIQLEHRVNELQNQEAERIRKEGIAKENG